MTPNVAKHDGKELFHRDTRKLLVLVVGIIEFRTVIKHISKIQ